MEIKNGKPSEISEGIVPLRIEKCELYTSSSRRRFVIGLKLRLEDGGFAYILSEQVFLRLHRQAEILYVSLPQSKGYYLENTEELLNLVIEQQTPIIFKRVIMSSDKMQHWDYLILDTSIESATAKFSPHF